MCFALNTFRYMQCPSVVVGNVIFVDLTTTSMVLVITPLKQTSYSCLRVATFELLVRATVVIGPIDVVRLPAVIPQNTVDAGDCVIPHGVDLARPVKCF